MTDPSGRSTVIPRSQLVLPGNCASCGRSDSDEGFVDTGIYIDFFGNVYHCHQCAEDIATAIGWHSPEDFKQLQNIADTLNSKLQEMTALSEEQKNELNTLRGAIQYLSPDTGDNLISGVVSASENDEEQPLTDSDGEGSADQLSFEDLISGEGESTEFTEPSKIDGPVNSESDELSDDGASPIGNLY